MKTLKRNTIDSNNNLVRKIKLSEHFRNSQIYIADMQYRREINVVTMSAYDGK